MNISSKINCDRCDVSPILPPGGGALPASPPPSKVSLAERPPLLRVGSPLGFDLGPLSARPVRRRLARDPSSEMLSEAALGVFRRALSDPCIPFSTDRNTTLAVRLSPLDFCAPPLDALRGLTVGPPAALSGLDSLTYSPERGVSVPTTSAFFESFVLSVMRCLPHSPFGASFKEHPPLPLHNATPSIPTRFYALVVPADRVRNATSSLVEFFCLLCTVFFAACTVCSAATVFSLLRRRPSATTSGRPEQRPQPALLVALAPGDVADSSNAARYRYDRSFSTPLPCPARFTRSGCRPLRWTTLSLGNGDVFPFHGSRRRWRLYLR